MATNLYWKKYRNTDQEIFEQLADFFESDVLSHLHLPLTSHRLSVRGKYETRYKVHLVVTYSVASSSKDLQAIDCSCGLHVSLSDDLDSASLVELGKKYP